MCNFNCKYSIQTFSDTQQHRPNDTLKLSRSRSDYLMSVDKGCRTCLTGSARLHAQQLPTLQLLRCALN